jgi:hypothetical protein
VATGLILLLLIAVLFAFGVTRARKRMGLGSTGKTWLVVIAGFAIIVLVIYVAQQK